MIRRRPFAVGVMATGVAALQLITATATQAQLTTGALYDFRAAGNAGHHHHAHETGTSQETKVQ